jgi:predicted phage tail protein
MIENLSGSGGIFGGGGRSSPQQQAQQVRQQIIDSISGVSNDYVKLVLGMCEGPIGGLIGGFQGVYFDKTPFQNSDGSFNFANVTVRSTNGTLSTEQAYNLIDATFSDNPLNIEVKYGFPQTRTISNADLTEIQVRLGFQLQYNDANGDIRQTGIGFQIYIKEGINGAFVLRYSDQIIARYSDQVAFNYRFPVNSFESYFEIRVLKLYPQEPPSPIPPRTSYVTANLRWISYTEITSDRIAYLNTALLGVQFPAKTFQSTPEIWAKVRGMICDIPTNATINTTDNGLDYSGGWNGSFYTPSRATADPAWIVWKLLTEPRFNLDIPSQYIDKYALYQCSVYNNQFVSNGGGGTERRFLFNTILGSGGQEIVLEMVRAICSSMYAKPYWNGSQISFWQDRPTTALPKVLTNADVEDGKFAYQTPELNTVTTVAKVSYQSTIEDWELIPEIVEDISAIQRYGVQVEEYALLGETRRGAAIRSGRRTILGSQPNNLTLTCRVRTRAMFFSPGDVIQVADSAKNRIRNGGLVSGVTSTKIIIDSPLTLTGRTDKKILLTLPDETVVERVISNGAGTFTEINLATALTVLPAPGSPWIITDTLSRTQLYRITEVNPVEDNLNLFDITARTYSADYYTQIESGIRVPVIIPVAKLPIIASPPRDVVCRMQRITYGERTSFTLVASWQRPTKEVNGVTIEEPYTDRYKVEFKRGETAEWGSTQITTELSARWENVGNGFFYVRVAAITTNNKVSTFVEAASAPQALADVSNQYFTVFTGEF